MKKNNEEKKTSLPKGFSTVSQLSYQRNSLVPWTQQIALISKEGKPVLIPFHSVTIKSK